MFNKLLNPLKKWWKNLLSKTPKKYRNIRNISLSISIIIPLVVALSDAPTWFETIKWYISVFGVLCATYAQSKTEITPTKEDN